MDEPTWLRPIVSGERGGWATVHLHLRHCKSQPQPYQAPLHLSSTPPRPCSALIPCPAAAGGPETLATCATRHTCATCCNCRARLHYSSTQGCRCGFYTQQQRPSPSLDASTTTGASEIIQDRTHRACLSTTPRNQGPLAPLHTQPALNNTPACVNTQRQCAPSLAEPCRVACPHCWAASRDT
jgi:hypothetical protein